MNTENLAQHLIDDHGIDGAVTPIIASDEDYLRGFHDGAHGRIDADDIEVEDHDHGLA